MILTIYIAYLPRMNRHKIGSVSASNVDYTYMVAYKINEDKPKLIAEKGNQILEDYPRLLEFVLLQVLG